ncbi:MAG TPA: polysaccharide deacetylase family protein [Bacteroidales bacterium]|nr:polysaccharide deacetylase family protein [Bacteroidales bacterium]
MILIYVSHITPRIAYVTNFIFCDVLRTTCELTTDKDAFLAYEGPSLNYSFEMFDAVTILPNRFMRQTEITDVDPGVSWINVIPVLFHECADVSLPFDPFAATFYLLSRYEEYTNHERDTHGRFAASSSLAYKHGFIEIPVVDIWAYMIRDVLQKRYPSYSFPARDFTFRPTIDIDIAYAYKGRSLLRNAGAVLKTGFRWGKHVQRIKTWMGSSPDPYDTFDLIERWHDEWKLRPVMFFQVGEYGKFDKNLPPHHPLMQKLIHKAAQYADIGLHPSYPSFLNSEIVKAEKKRLEEVSTGEITKSRQHYLRFSIPDTYRILEQCGISEDYSMGYADAVGFRAGTCTPFMFYDLSQEKETNLKIFPFCIMDGTLNQYLALDPQKALSKIMEMSERIKQVNGTMITIWHNQSFSGSDEWAGWQSVYPRMLDGLFNRK